MTSPPIEGLQDVLHRIASRASVNDMKGLWPTEDLADLASIGAMRWAIDPKCGGDDTSALELHDRYELIASASLATALVLSQRDAAIGYLEVTKNEALKNDLLTKLCRNEVWTTIGISHLTTSHQLGKLIAERDGNGWRLNGAIPWATGGAQSDFILAGALTTDNQQLIFVLPTDRKGVTVKRAVKLATLAAAPTTPIVCKNVVLDAGDIVAGPAEKALSRRTKGLPLGQAFAALGLTRGALALIQQNDLPSSVATHEVLSTQLNELSATVRNANMSSDDHDLQSGPLLRSECNSLAIRATHAAVTIYKGSGLCIDHPAQRMAREALFLLVWSSPSSVVDRTLELMSEPG